MKIENPSYPVKNEILNWNIEPIADDYRDLHIGLGFNWPKLLDEVTESLAIPLDKYYLVVFRSKRKEGEEIDQKIEELDSAAFQEAIGSNANALLHYFAGGVDEDNRAMSWCLWTDANSARDALTGPAHMEAVKHAKEFYDDNFSVDCYYVHPYTEDGIVFEKIERK
jgi:hypothetical protein